MSIQKQYSQASSVACFFLKFKLFLSCGELLIGLLEFPSIGICLCLAIVCMSVVQIKKIIQKESKKVSLTNSRLNLYSCKHIIFMPNLSIMFTSSQLESTTTAYQHVWVGLGSLWWKEFDSHLDVINTPAEYMYFETLCDLLTPLVYLNWTSRQSSLLQNHVLLPFAANRRCPKSVLEYNFTHCLSMVMVPWIFIICPSQQISCNKVHNFMCLGEKWQNTYSTHTSLLYLNNNINILLNLAEYPLILANLAYGLVS